MRRRTLVLRRRQYLLDRDLNAEILALVHASKRAFAEAGPFAVGRNEEEEDKRSGQRGRQRRMDENGALFWGEILVADLVEPFGGVALLHFRVLTAHRPQVSFEKRRKGGVLALRGWVVELQSVEVVDLLWRGPAASDGKG